MGGMAHDGIYSTIENTEWCGLHMFNEGRLPVLLSRGKVWMWATVGYLSVLRAGTGRRLLINHQIPKCSHIVLQDCITCVCNYLYYDITSRIDRSITDSGCNANKT